MDRSAVVPNWYAVLYSLATERCHTGPRPHHHPEDIRGALVRLAHLSSRVYDSTVIGELAAFNRLAEVMLAGTGRGAYGEFAKNRPSLDLTGLTPEEAKAVRRVCRVEIGVDIIEYRVRKLGVCQLAYDIDKWVADRRRRR